MRRLPPQSEDGVDRHSILTLPHFVGALLTFCSRWWWPVCQWRLSTANGRMRGWVSRTGGGAEQEMMIFAINSQFPP